MVLFEKALGIGKRGEAGVEYRKVYFRIRSRYQFDSGWPAETDAAKFHEESRSLFQSAGWDLQPGGDSTSDTVIKGQQELYLHPMNFSGIIEMDEIPAIQELLRTRNRSAAMASTAMRGIGNSPIRNIWHSWRPNARRSHMKSWNGAGQNGKTCISQARLL